MKRAYALLALPLLAAAGCIGADDGHAPDRACQVGKDMCVESTYGWPDEDYKSRCDETKGHVRRDRCSRIGELAVCERAMLDGVAVRIVFHEGFAEGDPAAKCREFGGRIKPLRVLDEGAAY